MSDVLSAAGIVAVLLIGVVSPGPSFLLVAQTAISQSRRAAMFSALGMALGAMLMCIVALAGVHALSLHYPRASFALKVTGGAYLLYLAAKLWRDALVPVAPPESARLVRTPLRHFAVALGLMLTNPKAAVQYGVVFGSLLPPQPPLALTFSLPIGVFVMEAGWYLTVAYVLSAHRPRSSYLGAKCTLDRAAAILLGALSIRLLAMG